MDKPTHEQTHGRFFLSYKLNAGEVVHEGIRKRKGGGLHGGGYYLEANELKRFKDLEALVVRLRWQFQGAPAQPTLLRFDPRPPPTRSTAHA